MQFLFSLLGRSTLLIFTLKKQEWLSHLAHEPVLKDSRMWDVGIGKRTKVDMWLTDYFLADILK